MSERFKALLQREIDLFDQDYKRAGDYSDKKPKDVGMPYFLESDSHRGALILHGYMAAPKEMRELADFVNSLGFKVYVPRLKGSGTSAEDLGSVTYHDWVESAERGYQILKERSSEIIVIGFSNGGSLALHQAIAHPERYRAVIAISPALFLKAKGSFIITLAVIYNRICRMIGAKKYAKEFIPNHPDNPEINYFKNPLHGIYELRRLASKVRSNIGKIKAPALLLGTDNDPVVDCISAEYAFKKVKSDYKVKHIVSHNKHGIVKGEISKTTFSFIKDFLKGIYL